MEWFTAAIQFAKEPQAWAFVLNLVLILIVDRRLLRIAVSLERNTREVIHFAEHNTSRMQEIRNALYGRVGWPIPTKEEDERRANGG